MRKRHKTRYPGIYYRLEDESKPDGPRRYIVWYSDANGDGHTQTLPLEASLEDARLLQGQLQARKAQGETLLRTRKDVSGLLDDWYNDNCHRWEETTAAAYRWGIAIAKSEFGRRRVGELSPSDVARLIAKLKKQGLKTWSVRKALTPLRSAYRVAVRDGLVASSPTDKLLPHEQPKADVRRMRCMTKDEIAQLIAACSTIRQKALFFLLVMTGLRISEALNLEWDDVEKDKVFVRQGKTPAAVREVPLPRDAHRLLMAWRLKQPVGKRNVFAEKAERSDPKTTLEALRRIEERAGIPDYTQHELRHTYASILISQGEPITLISRLMGHKDPSVTLKTYAHLFEAQESTDAALERLQSAMWGVV